VRDVRDSNRSLVTHQTVAAAGTLSVNVKTLSLHHFTTKKKIMTHSRWQRILTRQYLMASVCTQKQCREAPTTMESFTWTLNCPTL
jgi:hypothetical protein